jgi:alpha-galactosidase
VQEVNDYPGERRGREDGKTYSGDYLMTIGLDPQVHVDRASVVLRLTAI